LLYKHPGKCDNCCGNNWGARELGGGEH